MLDAGGKIVEDENRRPQLGDDKLKDMEMEMKCLWEIIFYFNNLVRDAVTTTETTVTSMQACTM